MNSILRTHGKTILAVLGAVLMLTFAIPSMTKNNTDAGSYEAGRLNGKKVVTGDINGANADIAILEAFGRIGVAPDYADLLTITAFPARDGTLKYLDLPIAYLKQGNTHEYERGTHWFLLLKQAERLGILVGENEVTDEVNKIPPESLRIGLENGNITMSSFRSAIAHALMIHHLTQMTMSSMPVAVPELEYMANENASLMQVHFATLDASKDFAKAPEPTAEQIQKQFDAYKDVIPAQIDSDTPQTPATINGHTFPFGYKYPDRIKAEYLKFDRAELNERFKPTREDVQEAYRYYTQHPEDPLISNRPNDPNTTVTTQPVTKPFDQVRDALIKRQVDARVDKFVKRLTDRISSVTANPWNNAKDVGGFREPIPENQWADYKSIPATIKSMPEFNGYAPQYHAISDFKDHAQLAKEPGIGDAVYERENNFLSFADLATHVHELGDFPNFPHLYLQVGIDGPLLKDDAGNVYIYRVTAADKSHDPATIDEVRPRVIEDLKKLETYEQFQTNAKAIAESASTGDFNAILQKNNLVPQITGGFRHQDPYIIPVGTVPGFADAAFNLVSPEAVTQPVSDSQPATQAASRPGLRNKTTTVSDDAALKVYILALAKYTPVTPEQYGTQRSQMIMIDHLNNGLKFAADWLSLETLVKRLNYTPARPLEFKPKT